METMLPYLAGPAGAVFALLVVIYGLYKLADTRLIPVVEKFIGRHLEQIDRLIASHDRDREVWAEGLTAVRHDIEHVREDVDTIRMTLDKLTQPPPQH